MQLRELVDRTPGLFGRRVGSAERSKHACQLDTCPRGLEWRTALLKEIDRIFEVPPRRFGITRPGGHDARRKARRCAQGIRLRPCRDVAQLFERLRGIHSIAQFGLRANQQLEAGGALGPVLQRQFSQIAIGELRSRR